MAWRKPFVVLATASAKKKLGGVAGGLLPGRDGRRLQSNRAVGKGRRDAGRRQAAGGGEADADRGIGVRAVGKGSFRS